MDNSKKHPIKVVSKRTGLTLHVIRAWEKRYQVVVPARTDSNRRLYSEQDIYKLKLMQRATQAGYNIGNIAGLSINALEEMLAPPAAAEKSPTSGNEQGSGMTDAKTYLDSCLDSIFRFNSGELEANLQQAAVGLSQPVLIEQVIMPLIEKIGTLWHDGQLRIMHEHMSTAIISTFLSNLRKNYRPGPNAPSIVITTPLGQVHELGAQLAALIAAFEGWHTVYLGGSMPAEEIAAAVQQTGSYAVALSIVYSNNDFFLAQEVNKLRELLPEAVPIIIGGRMATRSGLDTNHKGIWLSQDFTSFRNYLNQSLS